MAAPVPTAIVSRIRAICAPLPESYEEEAWVGTRWMIRKKTFAHVVTIEDGKPRAYAEAAGNTGPLTVLTVRIELSGAVAEDRFFEAIWGTTWGTKVLGIKLRPPIDWKETAALVAESYRLLAPKKLAALVGTTGARDAGSRSS